VRALLVALFAASSCFAYDERPWIGTAFEFELTPSYAFSTYSSVDGANRAYSSDDSLYALTVNGAVLPVLDVGAQVEFANTHRLSLGTRSGSVRLRYQFLDDIAGDPLSLTAGFITRFVPTRNMLDPSCPYQHTWNFEVSACAGKEFSSGPYWDYRTYLFVAYGHANAGRGWLRGKFSFGANFKNNWRLYVFSKGLFGFGHQNSVNIDRFQGYAHIHHQSIDLGAKGAYHFNIWGNLSLSYFYRLYAKNFPAHLQEVKLAYTLPFSFL